MPIKLAEEWLAMCGGCEISILDIGDPLLDLLPQLELVHFPVLMDHKYYGQLGEGKEIQIPQADLGIIAGAVRTQEHVELCKLMRKSCKLLIALGSCANFGGIPALGNFYTNEQIFEKVYRTTKSTDAAPTPSQEIPELTPRVMSVPQVVNVDLGIPGCPPASELVAEALVCLLQAREFKLPERSVCDECPTRREKKLISELKRPLEPIEFKPGQRYEELKCLAEQGYLCLGPVTKAGCGGKERIPRCIKALMPCRACFGPIRPGANPAVDMLGALASVGLHPSKVHDRAAMLNRYVGAISGIRPLKI